MKNKNNYLPNISVLAFGDHKTNGLYNIKSEWRVNISYMRFGEAERNLEGILSSPEVFVSWIKRKNSEVTLIEKPLITLQKNQEVIKNFLGKTDVLIIPLNTRDLDSINYAREFLRYMNDNNILVFFIQVNSIVNSVKLSSVLRDLRNLITAKKAILIDLHEIHLIESFVNPSILKRDQYVIQGLNSISESLIGTFNDITNNPQLYARLKALSLTRQDKNPDVWLVSQGTSNDKEDRFEKALFKALTSSIFRGAHSASEKFFLIVQGTFLNENKIKKVKEVFKRVVGSHAEVMIGRVSADYEFENVVTITIFARDINRAKLLDNSTDLKTSIRTSLMRVADLIQNEETREFILEGSDSKWEIVSEKVNLSSK
ncbi:hypothetical protein CJJ23_03975 [Mycoplasmopsis agassizii]|uniref:Uncharacterized protein n=1 Tax=Mycoplasmopsis agassizii TaxID=33922 RepID=A0A269TJJ1_9BACT|nr:hypothetical protein [Mycoplasmopsis agassizii]PAK21058.1 hypothetical protein CJJ23_03975 [Mycoplasmopsis agassizii]